MRYNPLSIVVPAALLIIGCASTPGAPQVAAAPPPSVIPAIRKDYVPPPEPVLVRRPDAMDVFIAPDGRYYVALPPKPVPIPLPPPAPVNGGNGGASGSISGGDSPAPAPVVTIVTPTEGQDVASASVRLTGTILLPEGVGGELKALRFLANGRPVEIKDLIAIPSGGKGIRVEHTPDPTPPRQSSPAPQTPQAPQTPTPNPSANPLPQTSAGHPYNFDVEVQPGVSANVEFCVFAYTKAGGFGSAAVHVKYGPDVHSSHVPVPPARPKQMPKLVVLAVGISLYSDKSLSTLNYAANDASDIVNVLQHQKDKLYSAIDAKILCDRDATLANVKNGIDWVTKEAIAGDVVLVLMSGHGAEEGGAFYFATTDADTSNIKGTFLNGEVLKQRLSTLPCKVVIALDSCHAGAESDADHSKGVPDYKKLAVQLQDVEHGFIVMTSCTADEISIEKSVFQHGAFALAMIEGLSGKRLYEQSAITPLPMVDGVVDVARLGDYVTKRVQEITQSAQHARNDMGRSPTFPIAVVTE